MAHISFAATWRQFAPLNGYKTNQLRELNCFAARASYTKAGSRASAPLRQPTTVRQPPCIAAAGFGGFGKSKVKKLSPQEACPCGSGQSYKACCRPFHDGTATPETPELLMRARYSAYARGVPDFVCEVRRHRPGTGHRWH